VLHTLLLAYRYLYPLLSLILNDINLIPVIGSEERENWLSKGRKKKSMYPRLIRAICLCLLACLLASIPIVLGNDGVNVGVTGDVGKDGAVSVGKLRASADVAFSNGDVDNAINILGKVIELEPKNENNFYKRFRFYIRQHKYKEALQDLNR